VALSILALTLFIGTAAAAPSPVEARKLREAGERIESAEDFIRLCASRSSVSGKPYNDH